MFTYINPNQTPDQIRAQYRTLALKHHPDHNPADKMGSTARMQAINAEYAAAMAAATRKAKPGKTESEYADLDRVNETLRAAIEAVITLEGITIEICGLWVWLAGNTKPNKDAIKAAGYKWASKKEKWYYAGVPASNRGHWDMEQIRSRYGSRTVRREDEKKPAGPTGNLA